jgi:hypothetical protein
MMLFLCILSGWPIGLRPVWYLTVRSLDSWVRNTPEAWMYVRVFLCCAVLCCRSMGRASVHAVLPKCQKGSTASEIIPESELTRGHNPWSVRLCDCPSPQIMATPLSILDTGVCLITAASYAMPRGRKIASSEHRLSKKTYVPPCHGFLTPSVLPCYFSPFQTIPACGTHSSGHANQKLKDQGHAEKVKEVEKAFCHRMEFAGCRLATRKVKGGKGKSNGHNTRETHK